MQAHTTTTTTSTTKHVSTSGSRLSVREILAKGVKVDRQGFWFDPTRTWATGAAFQNASAIASSPSSKLGRRSWLRSEAVGEARPRRRWDGLVPWTNKEAAAAAVNDKDSTMKRRRGTQTCTTHAQQSSMHQEARRSDAPRPLETQAEAGDEQATARIGVEPPWHVEM